MAEEKFEIEEEKVENPKNEEIDFSAEKNETEKEELPSVEEQLEISKDFAEEKLKFEQSKKQKNIEK